VVTPFGLFEFVWMPFGLRDAVQTFLRFIDQVLQGLTCSYAYIDDTLIASKNREDHLTHLRQVFNRLQAHGIHINRDKCVLSVSSLEFLGHHVDQDAICSLPCNGSGYPRVPTALSVASTLGLVNFYCRFVSGCALILQFLHAFLVPVSKKDANLTWNTDARAAFNRIKDALAKVSLLCHPQSDAPHLHHHRCLQCCSGCRPATVHQ
jgi:hypothetical protein